MCSYTGNHFGAHYEDTCCIDGFLWDLDSGDADGLTHGGDTPCPSCNTAAWLDSAKDDAESTSWGSDNGTRFCGAMIIEGALRKAERENKDATSTWKAENPTIKTFDWNDRQAVLEYRAPMDPINEITMNI